MIRRCLSIALLGATLIHLGALDGHAANLLLVTNNNGSLTSQESLRRARFQTWGYTVNTIWDAASQATFDAAFAVNDVVYVSEEVNANDVRYKLRNAPIGVLNEDQPLTQELGISASNASSTSTTRIVVTDNSHPITQSFATGWLTIASASIPATYLGGATAPGGATLATINSRPALFVIDTGGTLVNTYNGNSTAAGRRVQLPFGGNSFNFNRLNSNGLTLLENALEWAADGSGAPDLVGHWKLNETSGTTAADSSDYSRDGTIYGAVHWSNRCSGVGVFDFDGSSNYVSVANAPNLQPTSAVTITAWIKGDAWSSGSEVNAILRKGENNPNNYQLAVVDGQVALYLDDSDTAGIRGNTVLTPGQWYHVAAVWDGATVCIYVNGQLDNLPAPRTGTINEDTRALYIGGRSGDDCFDGMIYDVRLYNYALDLPEIAKIYGLVGHWKLDETGGPTAADSSPMAVDGTVSGPPHWDDGYIDGAIQLNGTNHVVIPSLMDSPPNVSIAAWANLTNHDSGGSEIFSIGDYFAMRLDNTSSSSYAFFYNGSNWTQLNISRTFDDTGWHHFVIVFDDDHNTFKIYVDGEEAASMSTSQSIIYTGLGNSTTIGAHGNGQTSYDFSGLVDDVRIYNRVLCPTEIEQLYGSGGPAGVRIIKWVEIQ